MIIDKNIIAKLSTFQEQILIPWKGFLFCLVFVFLQYSSFGQGLNLKLEMNATDSLMFDQLKAELEEIPRNFTDSMVLKNNMNASVNALHQMGHIESFVQYTTKSDSLWIAKFKIGPVYKWINLGKGNLTEEMISKLGFREQFYEDEKFDFNQLRKLQEKVLVYAENNGYPFAEIGLQNIVLESGRVEADIRFESNNFIIIDSIRIQGNVNINSEFLQNYFGIEQGDAYNESLLRKIKTKSKELPFIKEVRSPNVLFALDRATVDLYYKDINASNFNLLLGVLPNQNVDRGYSLSGEGQINLLNTLGAGEEFDLQYKSYPGNATQLKTKFVYPFLPFIPIGLDAKFDLYLRDSLYRNINLYTGLMYNLGGTNFVQLFYESRKTDLTAINQNQIIQSKKLPADLDVKNSYYGLAVHYEKLDYRFNPISGWVYKGSLALGTKKVPLNNAILDLQDPFDPTFDFKDLYREISTQSLQIKSEYSIEKFWKLLNRSTIRTRFYGAVIRNLDENAGDEIYDNERFFIGGNQDLRGFDEQSLFTDWYNVMTLEYRYLLGQNSNFFVFSDVAYLTNLKQELALDQRFWAYGFGAGINFETEAGVFGISYALGSQKNNAIQVRNGKIHFGYVNYF